MKKIKTGTMLYPETIKLCDDNLIKANVTSRNNYIEDAIHFYSTYLSVEKNHNFLVKLIDDSIISNLNLLEEQLNAVLFNFSVELAILNRIIASALDIDNSLYKKLRASSLEDVKKSNGTINLDELLNKKQM